MRLKNLFHYLKRAVSIPPHIAVRKAVAKVFRRYTEARERKRDIAFPTYGLAGFTQGWTLTPRKMDLTKVLTLLPIGPVLEKSRRLLAHEFDLLGSGWVKVRHGAKCAGLEGSFFDPGERVTADSEGRWLSLRINEKNLPESRRIWGLIEQNYEPIDWQLDFKSGYRWFEKTLSRDIAYGALRGQDVKVPWELARMQHLPTLAWAFGLALQKIAEFEAPEVYAQEFRNQILDFIATSPPRYGVNWACTMDVGIRVANWILAYDLFHSLGTKFDSGFEETFARSVIEHADHIYHHLEWDPLLRSNHYLADIAGLLWASAHLPKKKEHDRWLAFATGELKKEVRSQFGPDGANFEASTSYHRLSSEMVVYAAALGMGLGEKNPVSFVEKIEPMADFTLAFAKPDGKSVQVGDNDSGRFFKLIPVEENTLDHRHLIAAFNGLLNRADLGEFARGFEAETEVIRQLAGETLIKELHMPDAHLDGISYPDFGLYRMTQGAWWLCVRCGSVGQKGNGGHAHNDQLSFELCLEGRSLLVDPGTYLYTPLPEERNRFRSTAMHNTLSFEGLEQNPFGPELFRLEDMARARVMDFQEGLFVGEHQGFGSVHRRTLKLDEKGLNGLDECRGKGIKSIYFHAAPGWKAKKVSAKVARLSIGGQTARFESPDGEWSVEEGFYSGEYGNKERAEVLILKSEAKIISWSIMAGEK